MVIGDGVLTPCISVLFAVGGITSLSTDAIVGISVAILIGLFCAQRFGTNKVSYLFAPTIVLWFLVIAVIGVYDLLKHDVGVLRAFNPKYIVDYFKRDGKKAWTSLGGVFLCITGTEAMFADLGRFSVRAIQISFSGVVFPALIAAYCGQAAYLVKFPENVGNTFYASIPGKSTLNTSEAVHILCIGCRTGNRTIFLFGTVRTYTGVTLGTVLNFAL
ncbi:hypothetical protein RHGRI_033993 [Rhododendron griersonianum]|uniref:K+ potassium transporter integral membrane domain-containing protein n=1 Tax=Rhododendron griersonianum TaxID=479676 RepID=A0AAV6HZA9_9ERIC|nr:hypothetical protein RHGRI_033993 [Rhododendron griersonianum]